MSEPYFDSVWATTPMPEDYTCHCGLYVHPSRRNPDAIHIEGCQYCDAGYMTVTGARRAHAACSVRDRRFCGVGELERTGYIPAGSADEREAKP